VPAHLRQSVPDICKQTGEATTFELYPACKCHLFTWNAKTASIIYSRSAGTTLLLYCCVS
jgi:hypothetical protein